MVVAALLDREVQPTPWTTPETPLAEAARLMAATGYGAIPVLCRDGRLLGMLVERDLLRLAAERRAGLRGLAVEAAMTRDATTVPAGAPVDAALRAIASARVRHLPVCDHEGRVIGLVGLADLLRSGAALPVPTPTQEESRP
jgi:CBS domain-containing protein